jgi:RNA polymerase sigma-70 factor (ECF subfamily)
VSGGTEVVQDAPAPTPAQLRRDFGAHLEANYRRLVAQLYAITFDPAEAHSAVQDAYSRAWRTWATVSRSPDSVGWVRRVAVRSTIRSWRRLRLRSRRPVGPGPETSTGAVLAALRRLARRRAAVRGAAPHGGRAGQGDRRRRGGLGRAPPRPGSRGRRRS